MSVKNFFFKERNIFLKLVLTSLILVVSIFTINLLIAKAVTVWPTSWATLNADLEDCSVDARDVITTYYSPSTEYLYLKMNTVSSPETSSLYKWFLDFQGNAYIHGASIIGYEKLIIVYNNAIYFCDPADNKVSNCSVIADTDIADFKLEGTSVYTKIRLSDLGSLVKSVWWTTESNTNNISQQSYGGNVDWSDSASSDIPFIPVPYCGDGNLNSGEQCDDHNNIDGDGCSSTCQIEPTCTDADNDGYAVEGDACGAVDCDDSNANIHPGATETCNNTDDDCDGFTDEGLLWSNKGQTCTLGLGICTDTGLYICNGSDPSGPTICSAVPGLPSSETCNNLDDDCDGTIDEELTQPTTCGAGVCTGNTGIKTCSAGSWIGDTCNPYQGATTEVCDGVLDEDCDGLIDEDCTCTDGDTQPCGATNQGACEYGTQTCSSGQWGECVGYVGPTTETCDNVDNDCDGAIDEGFNLGEICSVGIGSCLRTGAYVCSGGTSVCSATAGQPETEICNNADDDCDGMIDESLTNPTTCGVGVCSGNTGYETCSAGVWGGNNCNPFEGAGAEVCDPGLLDENCDGSSNEECECLDGTNQPCGITEEGACEYGTQTCSSGQWGECIGYVGPTTETCDNVDNDCDGA
ncbi:MAG: MopE-related protein, partial [Candidatus Paceibacterota bacterium]